jgi:hypothetical protein
MQDSAKPSNQTDKRDLTIRSMPDGFSFCLSTSEGDVVRQLQTPARFDFPDLFEEFVQDNGWKHQNNLNVSLLDFTNHFMLIPSEITEEEAIKKFFRFQYSQEDEYQIYTIPLDDNKQTFCWEIPVGREQCFEQLFPNLSLLSSSYILANWTFHRANLLQSTVLAAHAFGGSMQLFIANPDRLIFANTFQVRTHEDFLYFLLHCIEQSELEVKKTTCFICSDSTPAEELRERLTPYLPHLELAEFTLHADEFFRVADPNNNTTNENN